MATKRFITDENLKRFGTNVKSLINQRHDNLTDKIDDVNDTAEAAKSAAATAQATANSKIASVKTINGQSLVGTGNITLADIGIDGEIVKIVTELPAASAAVSNKMYLVPVQGSTETENVYAEYVKVTKDGKDAWEKLGEWKADIAVDGTLDASSTNPIQNKAVKAALDQKVDKVTGYGLSQANFTSAEKTKLAGIADGANKYTLPVAKSGTLGGILPGTTSGKTYGVAVATSGAATVSVPWTDQNVLQNVLPAQTNKEIPLLGSAATAGGTAAGTVYLSPLCFNLSTGTLTASKVKANVTGNLTGDVNGNLTGNVTGDVSGNASTATNALNDEDGNSIKATYFKTEDFATLTETDIDNLWNEA